MRNLKLVKVATVRKHMDAFFREEISYTEAVNRINEDANEALSIANVSNHRELLLAFAGWLYGNLDKEVKQRIVDDYLNSK